MSVRIFVPCDAAALSVGADKVAKAIVAEAAERGHAVTLVRNGTRGMLWLEPLVEVETPAGRVAYGPVKPADVAGLFDAGFLNGQTHKLAHGLTEAIPYFARQQRLTFVRVGITDPLSLEAVATVAGETGRVSAAMQQSVAGLVSRLATLDGEVDHFLARVRA